VRPLAIALNYGLKSEKELLTEVCIMAALERYQELVDMGLIIPNPESPLNFKFPSLLIDVPNTTTNGVVDPEVARKVALNAQLERDLK
jgi:hypothetical protein